MLTMKESITVTGRSIIDGKEVHGYQATIDSKNPAAMHFSPFPIDKDLYKANRAECRADEAEFEDYCYSMQDEMQAALDAEVVTEAAAE